MLARALGALALATLAACRAAEVPTTPQPLAQPQQAAWQSLAGSSGEAASVRDEVTAQGKGAHGLYFSYGYLQRFGSRGVWRTLDRTRMNAAVLDVKDSSGRISHRTRVEALAPSVAERPLDMKRIVRALKKRGIYTIARIVCFNDPLLAHREPARAIMDARKPERVWRSRSTDGAWLDPYNRDNHALVVALAREAEAQGFDEIQLDYIRFPVDPTTEWALYPAEVDTPRAEVLLELLRDADAALRIPLGVDVFGLAARNEGDPSGLGQSLGEWTKHVEVISPMLYVNGMKTWNRDIKRGRAGFLVQALTRKLRERIGTDTVIRPFIQAFETGADYWDGTFIREQIDGAREGGADGFLFWHPGSDYAMVGHGVRRLPAGALPFR
jgi:hypothetical protein